MAEKGSSSKLPIKVVKFWIWIELVFYLDCFEVVFKVPCIERLGKAAGAEVAGCWGALIFVDPNVSQCTTKTPKTTVFSLT